MFAHLFVYNLKCIVRDKAAVFWSFFYPIVLATLFFFAFSNLNKADVFAPVAIAAVDGGGLAESPFYGALAAVSDIDGEAGEGDIFTVRTANRDEADSLLKSGSIAAYIVYDKTPGLVVSNSGLNQTIAKMFLDSYLQSEATFGAILAENPQADPGALLADLSQRVEYLREVSASPTGKTDSTVVYYYALLAMTCLMGSTVAIEEIIRLQANLSPLAARVGCAPAAKFKIFLCNMAALILYQIAVILVVLAFLAFGLRIDFGDRAGYILLTCLVGCVCGVFFGTAVSAGFKSAGIKYAITIGGTMLSCFLSGMMNIDMKYVIQTYAPAVRYVSPANLISDALYSLYYYGDLGRYFENIAVLAALSAALCAVTCLQMRRKRYASL